MRETQVSGGGKPPRAKSATNIVLDRRQRHRHKRLTARCSRRPLSAVGRPHPLRCAHLRDQPSQTPRPRRPRRARRLPKTGPLGDRRDGGLAVPARRPPRHGELVQLPGALHIAGQLRLGGAIRGVSTTRPPPVRSTDRGGVGAQGAATASGRATFWACLWPALPPHARRPSGRAAGRSHTRAGRRRSGGPAPVGRSGRSGGRVRAGGRFRPVLP